MATTVTYQPQQFREQARIERGLGSRIRPQMWEQAAVQCEQIAALQSELAECQARAQHNEDIARIVKRFGLEKQLTTIDRTGELTLEERLDDET